MIISQVTGKIVADAVIKKTSTGKEYIFFSVYSFDEKKNISLVKCYHFTNSQRTKSILKKDRSIFVVGSQNCNLFQRDDGEIEININPLAELKR